MSEHGFGESMSRQGSGESERLTRLIARHNALWRLKTRLRQAQPWVLALAVGALTVLTVQILRLVAG